MVILKYRLPQIERPTEEILDDDDNKVLAAFDIVLNGYKKAQKRTREITKAYNELESITLKILKKYHDDKEIPTKKERDKFLINGNNVQSSTPKAAQDYPRKTSDCENANDNVEMIDLTSIFDNDQNQHVEYTSPDTSLSFGETRKSRSKKQKSSPNELPRDNCVENFPTNMEPTTSKVARISNKSANNVENQAGNEENRPPIEKSPNSSDSFSHQNEAARSSAKIGLAKSIYNIGTHKTPNRNSMKQATLVFQPISAKTDLTNTEKPTVSKTDVSRHWGNLFDEDYRTRKRNNDSIKRQIKKTNIEDSPRSVQRAASSSTLTREKSEFISPRRNNEDVKERVKELPRKNEKISIIIPTESEIDETARSLFDDEDPENFPISPDILNTCAESSELDVFTQPIVNDRGKMKIDQSANNMDSIDETFYGPAEIKECKTDANERQPLAGCSKIFGIKDPRDNVRNLKRKCDVETNVTTGKEIDDLALQDINWDSEISNENWVSAKRSVNDSFDVPPDKAKKSPEYAYKGKIERSKAKRNKLRGWDCWQCEKYYGNMDLPEDELKKRMDACSRHRSKFNPRYYTPAGFWNPEFPDATDSSDCSENDHPCQNRV